MALQFKRTRLDAAHERTFPNSKEEVIFRNDVSNKNLLKNPFRTSGIPVGPVGVQNRPINSLVDSRGNLFAQSSTVLRDHITNNNLLHNPYRFKVDPIDEPRTLSMQVIKEINNGTAPQYIRENKGIDEIAFTIVKSLPDNGVKLATISMLKSYITGLRLQSVLDQGGQNVTRAFDVLNQLIVVATNLFKTGMLNMKLPALLLDYSSNIAKVFGDTVLQPVSPMLMFSAIQDLASVSSVLSKLFKSQNAISPPTNVSIDEWSRMEAARLQSLREGEKKQEVIDNNAPQIKTDGDNQPTGTQGIRDADTIKQEGGRRYKKKKIPKTGSGLTVSWGTTSPNVPSNAQSVPVEKPSDVVNIMPIKPVSSLSKFETGFNKAVEVSGKIIPVALGAYGLYKAISESRKAGRQEVREIERDAREQNRYEYEIQNLSKEQKRKSIEEAENEKYLDEDIDNILLLNPVNKKFYMKVYATRQLLYDDVLQHGLSIGDLQRIMAAQTLNGKRNILQHILISYQNNGIPLGTDRNIEEAKQAPAAAQAGPAAAQAGPAAAQAGLPPAQLGEVRPFHSKSSTGYGRKRKSKKSTKSKIKKSKNLDAQILALLRA